MQGVGGSSPLVLTRLSLDAIRVPGSFLLSAFAARAANRIFFVTERRQGRLSLPPLRAPAFVGARWFYSRAGSVLFFVSERHHVIGQDGNARLSDVSVATHFYPGDNIPRRQRVIGHLHRSRFWITRL